MYKDCLNCPELGVTCDGPNFMALTAAEILEWCKLRKSYMKLSNKKLAELSKIPEGTIARLFAGEHMDFKYESIRPILRVLVGGSFDNNPCPDPHEADNQKQTEIIEKLQAENASLKETVNRFEAMHHEDMQQAKETIAYLKAQVRDRKALSFMLGVGLAVAVVAIILMLI
jgi:hypothetical protein